MPNQIQSREQSKSFEDFSFDLEQILTETISLKKHLAEQVTIDFSDLSERLIAGHLIELIDETGYFTEDLEAIAQNLGCEYSFVLSVFPFLYIPLTISMNA